MAGDTVAALAAGLGWKSKCGADARRLPERGASVMWAGWLTTDGGETRAAEAGLLPDRGVSNEMFTDSSPWSVPWSPRDASSGAGIGPPEPPLPDPERAAERGLWGEGVLRVVEVGESALIAARLSF